MPKKQAVVKLRFWHVVDEAGLTIRIDGLRVRSEANIHQHWAKKQPRKAADRMIVTTAMHHAGPHYFTQGPLAVRFTRMGGRRLDPDNLGNGFKWIQDAVFKAIGRDDGEKEIEIKYAQEPGPSYAVQIAIDRR